MTVPILEMRKLRGRYMKQFVQVHQAKTQQNPAVVPSLVYSKACAPGHFAGSWKGRPAECVGQNKEYGLGLTLRAIGGAQRFLVITNIICHCKRKSKLRPYVLGGGSPGHLWVHLRAYLGCSQLPSFHML